MPATVSEHQKAYLGEVHKMLEAGIQVGFLAQAANASEVCVINVCIHSEEALEHGAHHVNEVRREGDTVLLREDPSVIHLQTTSHKTFHVCQQAYASWRQSSDSSGHRQKRKVCLIVRFCETFAQ